VTEAADHAYVFGGAGQDNGALADLWRVDRESLRFERVRPAGNGPSARYAGTLITDHERGRLLLFGGQGSSAMSDVWELVDGAADEPVSSSPVPTSAAVSDAVEGDGPSPSPAPTPPRTDADRAAGLSGNAERATLVAGANVPRALPIQR
jgi:hypothetical protein